VKGGVKMGAQKTYAFILGFLLVIIGIWGFFTESILGIFGVNTLQSVIYIIAGLFGLYVGTNGEGPEYNSMLGWIGLLLGILGFIPGVDTILANLLKINTEISVLHLVLGVITLSVYYGASKKTKKSF